MINQRRMKLLFVASVLCVLGASAPAAATQYDLIADVRIQTSYVEDASYDAVAEDDILSSFHLGVGYGLESVLPGLRTYFIYETALNEPMDRLGESTRIEWGQHVFLLAGEWGPELWGFLRPYARVGIGYALQTLDLSTDGASATMYDYAHDFAYTGSAGFEAFWKLEGVTLAFMGQFGYRGQTESEFDELRYDADDLPDDGFEREELSVGTIDTNALFWDLGVGVRFAF